MSGPHALLTSDTAPPNLYADLPATARAFFRSPSTHHNPTFGIWEIGFGQGRVPPSRPRRHDRRIRRRRRCCCSRGGRMKIQCNACEAAEANVLCCADEAALCWACDHKVHTANKLASKHQRVPLTAGSSSQVPNCDICQEASGYFFCLEDRALMCRKCDIAIHSVNSYVSAHQRFLLTGVRVGPELIEPAEPFPVEQPSPPPPSRSTLKRTFSRSLSDDTNEVDHCQVSRNEGLPASRTAFVGGTVNGSMSDWVFDDFFGMDFNQNYGFTGHESSKADSGKLGSSEGSQFYCFADEELGLECESQVPDIQWTVPEIPSPPTASGLSWPNNLHRAAERSAFVPDVCASSFQDISRNHLSASVANRSRKRHA